MVNLRTGVIEHNYSSHLIKSISRKQNWKGLILNITPHSELSAHFKQVHKESWVFMMKLFQSKGKEVTPGVIYGRLYCTHG